MLWYIAIIAALNIGLGYLWATWSHGGLQVALGHGRLSDAAAWSQSQDDGYGDAATSETPDAAPDEQAPSAAEERAPLDPATGLVTREHAESLLTKFTENAEAGSLTVALIEVDATESASDEAVDQRVLCGVSNVVRQSLTADHTAARYAKEQLLLLVPHEDVEQATRRAEELRQRVANTEFVVDGQPIKATVTCALTQLAPERTSEQLLQFLQESLTEAKRYGGNRTFTHDGSSPAPVVPPELGIAPQQLAI